MLAWEQHLEVMRRKSLGATPEYYAPVLAIHLVSRITGVPDHFSVAQEAAEIVLSSSPTPHGVIPALASHRGIILVSGLVTIDRVLGLLAPGHESP